jgi:hypothetical protein
MLNNGNGFRARFEQTLPGREVARTNRSPGVWLDDEYRAAVT